MYFDLTEEQKSIEETVRTYLREQLDDTRALQLFDAGILDRSLWRDLMGLGIGATLIPPEQEGLGLDLLTLSVLGEALGHHCVPAPVLSNALAAWVLACCGEGALKTRWVSSLANGDEIAAFALFESDRGWLEEDWTLGGVSLTGSKQHVEWGKVADVFIVGLKGGRLGVVDAHSSGVKIADCNTLDRSRPVSSVIFEGVAVVEIQEMDAAARVVDALLVLLAADACGAGMRAYKMAVDYANSRTQFGQVISRFQALKHQLANMAIDMEPCRALHWYAAHAWDSIPDKRRRTAATAKAHITELAVKTARAAVEAHGGIGYTWEYPLHLYLKRAMHSRISMGSPTVHRERMARFAKW